MATVLQLGHSRDGGRYYLQTSHRRGWRCVLIENMAGRKSIEWGDRMNDERYDTILLAGLDQDLGELADTVVDEVVAVVAGFELFRLDACRVARRLGVPSCDEPAVLHRMRFKSAQRQWLASTAPGIRQPHFAVCTKTTDALAAAAAIGYPVVVKPDDSGGSANVILVHDQTALRQAADDLKRDQVLDDGRPTNGKFLIEEAILGPEMGVQGVVDADGHVHVVSVSSKSLNTAGGRFLEWQHYLQPPTSAPETVLFAADTITALGLLGSAFHMDVRIRHGAPVLIETGARLSGAYIPLALATAGIDWADLSLRVATGSRLTTTPVLKKCVSVELLTADSFPTRGLVKIISTTSETLYLIDMERAINGGSYTHFGDRVGVKIVIDSASCCPQGRCLHRRCGIVT